MLVLTRKPRQRLVITVDGVEIDVVVLDIGGGRVRLGIDAPPSVKVWRKELIGRNMNLPPTEDTDG